MTMGGELANCLRCKTKINESLSAITNCSGFCSKICKMKSRGIIKSPKPKQSKPINLTIPKSNRWLSSSKSLDLKLSKRLKRKQLKRDAQRRKELSYRRSDEFLESQEWRRLRYVVLVKFGRVCQCCGRKAPDVIIQVDHVKPRSLFPELALDESNLQVLCRDCNLGKGAKFNDDFRPKPETV